MTATTTIMMVAAHKEYEMPSDEGYDPVHVGKELNGKELGFIGDNEGDNISALNPYYCELTGLYWMWKNTDASFYGLAHYRRYFQPVDGAKVVSVKGEKVASTSSLTGLLSDFDIVLAKPRNYWVETIESHYKNAHHIEDLDKLRSVIADLYPEYVPSLEAVLKGRSISLFNMFVMRGDHFKQYCSWLFSILFALQDKVPYQ